jgi:hypothetical protein
MPNQFTIEVEKLRAESVKSQKYLSHVGYDGGDTYQVISLNAVDHLAGLTVQVRVMLLAFDKLKEEMQAAAQQSPLATFAPK